MTSGLPILSSHSGLSRVKGVASEGFDPDFKKGVGSKKQGKELLVRGIERLAEYQSRLCAEDTHGVLVVLQALDAAGKDGTIRHVMSGVNPQGVSVHSFKVPSGEELDHDYFWRFSSGCQAVAKSASSIGRTTRRWSSSACIRSCSTAKSSHRSKGTTAMETAVPGDQQLGAQPLRQRVPDREIVPQPLEGGTAIRFLRRIDLADHNWKFRPPT